MDIKDLMVGDWVIRKGIPKEHLQVVNWNINGKTVNLELDGLGITEYADNLEPIPLTYGILEANFGKSQNKLNLDPQYLAYPTLSNCMISAQLRPSPDCRKRLSVYNYTNRRGITYECTAPDDVEKPFYVNELQHMMRECGINDEVIL